MAKKKFPIGTQDFETLNQNSEFYLDKTPQLLSLLEYGGRYNFLSRPRRFGKSLMLSALKHLFLGKKELFKDLYIYDKLEFKKFPVLHLSFAGFSEKDDLNTYIEYNGRVHLDETEIKLKEFDHFNLGVILEETSQRTGQPVVVLVDEYDKPILAHLKNLKKAEEIRQYFQDFYAPVKDHDRYIRFFMLTGLTKLMKMNIFSVLNNLDDISFEEDNSDIVGYTQAEIETNFSEEIEEIAKQQNKSVQQLMQQIKAEYNGYNFGDKSNKLYNPWDINAFVKKRKFGSYWSDTGIPSAISDYIKENAVDVQQLIDSERENRLLIDELDLRVHNLDDLTPEVLFFNAGYLTIRSKEDNDEYYLKFPNREAEKVMLKYFLKLLLKDHYNLRDWKDVSQRIASGIFNKDSNLIQQGIYDLIYQNCAEIPYDWNIRNPEGWLKSMVGVAIRMNNIYYIGENQNIIGRTDLHIPKEGTVYVLEFKVNQGTDTAMTQIEKEYEPSYRNHFAEVVKIGINWDKEKKTTEVLIK